MNFDFYNFTHYIGSDGENVEVKPVGRQRWAYRFPKDRRWRISKNKFYALLEAAWELGKSGEKMDWTPRPKQKGCGRSIYKSWAKLGHT